MAEGDKDMSEYPLEDNEKPHLVEEIRQRLGELGISGYTNLPRRPKKAAKKLALGKTLTQRELARLDALRRRQSGS